MDCLPQKSGCCREVAVVERWPLVEIRLYTLKVLPKFLIILSLIAVQSEGPEKYCRFCYVPVL